MEMSIEVDIEYFGNAMISRLVNLNRDQEQMNISTMWISRKHSILLIASQFDAC